MGIEGAAAVPQVPCHGKGLQRLLSWRSPELTTPRETKGGSLEQV
jgi:hypothetical protein